MVAMTLVPEALPPSPTKDDPLRPPSHLAAAAKARGETDAARSAGLDALRSHLATSAAAVATPARHGRFLTALAVDVPFLLAFLRWARFSIPAATARLDRFTAFVAAHPSWAARPSTAEVSAVLGVGVLSFTPCTDGRGRTVATLAGGGLEALIARVGLAAINRVAFWAYAALLRSPSVSIAGVVQVQHLAGLGWGILGSLRSANGLEGLTTLTSVLPLRLGGIAMVEAPAVMGLAWRLVRKALSPKVRARVRMLPSMDHLAPDVDVRCLPVALGGQCADAAAYTVELVMAGVVATPWMELQ